MNGCICSLLLALAAGGGLLADKLLFTDPATGFSTSGSVWIRYGALAVISLAFLLLVRPKKAKAGARMARRSRPLAAVFGVQAAAFFGGCGMALVQIFGDISAAGGFFDRYTGKMTVDPVRLLITVGWLAGGLWCSGIALGFGRGEAQPMGGLPLGIGTTAAFFLLCARRFVLSPTSIQRVTPTLDLMGALAAMLLCCGLLRMLYLPAEQQQLRRLCFFGLEAFLFDFCVIGAKQAANLSLGLPVFQEIGDLPLLVFGLLGAVVAADTIYHNPRPKAAHFAK